jgi:hypothetical protein
MYQIHYLGFVYPVVPVLSSIRKNIDGDLITRNGLIICFSFLYLLFTLQKNPVNITRYS